MKPLRMLGVPVVTGAVLLTTLVPAIGLANDVDAYRDDSLDGAVEEVGATLSTVLEAPEHREYVVSRLLEAVDTRAVSLREVVWDIGSRDHSALIYGLMATIDRAEALLDHQGAQPARIDLFLPGGPVHPGLLGAPTVGVAVSPIAEGGEGQIPAFYDGEATLLSASEAPESPTIVVGVGETTSDPGYPPILDDAPDGLEAAPLPAGGYVGIPHILITDDHEPWWRGDPEIYVVTQRFTSAGVPKDVRTDLTGVNQTDQWYFLHDPNATYAYVDDHLQPVIHIHVWEDDGSLDEPDYLGFYGARWDELPETGYTEADGFFGFDARLYLDRD